MPDLDSEVLRDQAAQQAVINTTLSPTLEREISAADWDESPLYIQSELASPPSLSATTNNLLSIQGSDLTAQLKCTLTQASVLLVNEVGVFVNTK